MPSPLLSQGLYFLAMAAAVIAVMAGILCVGAIWKPRRRE